MADSEITVKVETPEPEPTPAAAPVTQVVAAPAAATESTALEVGQLMEQVSQLKETVTQLGYKVESAESTAQAAIRIAEPVEEVTPVESVVEVVPVTTAAVELEAEPEPGSGKRPLWKRLFLG